MAKKRIPVVQTKAWKELGGISPLRSLRQIFSSDPDRFASFSVDTQNIILDYSRQLVDRNIIQKLISLAEETGLKASIEAMFTGAKINVTEGRAVLHTALRNLSDTPVIVDGKDVMTEVKAVLEKTNKYSEEVISGKRLGITGKKIKNIVSIGIGGSYLGPEYLAEACAPYAKPGMKLIFISNVDGTDFARKTLSIDPEETLFVIVSKTFTTAETMKNAESAKAWMLKRLGDNTDVIKKHFIAVSTAAEKVKAFGIDIDNMFVFWDWVGGRFSATSAVGAVPLSLYLGYDNFHKILEGANWMDLHFRNEPFERNVPVLAALIDIWNINFLGFGTRAILPYSQAYCKYAPHCQQTEMESNGKSVDIEGRPVEFKTGEIVFGEPGTNGQHSFYQLIHQGTEKVPCDFIGFIKEQYPDAARSDVTHHEELMTNFFAQPDALAFGKTAEEVRHDETREAVVPHKVFLGNKPSSVYLLEEQDPFTAGMMLAFLEHRVAAKGFIWGINSFDQFGVELGKVLAKDMRRRTELAKANPNDPRVLEGLNQSTSEMYAAFLKGDLS